MSDTYTSDAQFLRSVNFDMAAMMPVSEDAPQPVTQTDPLRVMTWDDYVGQTKMKEMLEKRILASVITQRPLDHFFLGAPPGYGKTSLCGVIADRLGVPFYSLKMTPSMKERDFHRAIMAVERPCLYLLDEIHAANKAVQELLLPMTDAAEGYIQNRAGKRESVEGITFALATTEPHRVNKALLTRFKVKPHFDDYTDEELAKILYGMAQRMEVPMTGAMAQQLAPACAFTPRIAGSVATAAHVLHAIGEELTPASILELAGFDADGLSPEHLDYLRALDDLGGVAGIKNIVMMLQLPLPHVEDLERLLVKRNFVTLESTGRRITGGGMRKIGIQPLHTRSS